MINTLTETTWHRRKKFAGEFVSRLLPQRSTPTWWLDRPCHSSHSLPLLSPDKRAKVRLMGHNKGRDNAKKRAKRRKKNERLALAKKNKEKAEK